MHSWFGTYGVSAFIVAIDRCFSKNPKAEYIKNALLYEIEKENLTQEELDEIELRKMLYDEEMWIRNDTRRNLPKTILK